MSSPCVLFDSNGDEFHLHQNYVRYGNRILDASFIATVTVKKHKLLFNNFKQNTTMPVLTVPFKKESDARQALNKCVGFYELCHSNNYYEEDDERNEVFLSDAYGGVMQVAPDFLRYRDRVLSSMDVRTVHLKGRRVLVNHFKGNVNVPTMCVHFADKAAAAHALSTIHSILWNASYVVLKPNPEPLSDTEEEVEGGRVAKAMELLDKPVDPSFLTFLTVSIGFLFAINMLRLFVGNGSPYDEL